MSDRALVISKSTLVLGQIAPIVNVVSTAYGMTNHAYQQIEQGYSSLKDGVLTIIDKNAKASMMWLDDDHVKNAMSELIKCIITCGKGKYYGSTIAISQDTGYPFVSSTLYKCINNIAIKLFDNGTEYAAVSVDCMYQNQDMFFKMFSNHFEKYTSIENQIQLFTGLISLLNTWGKMFGDLLGSNANKPSYNMWSRLFVYVAKKYCGDVVLVDKFIDFLNGGNSVAITTSYTVSIYRLNDVMMFGWAFGPGIEHLFNDTNFAQLVNQKLCNVQNKEILFNVLHHYITYPQVVKALKHDDVIKYINNNKASLLYGHTYVQASEWLNE